MIAIKSHLIYLDGKQVPHVRAKNQGRVITPEFIVCHDTASGLTPNGDIDWLARSSPNSSAHVVIDRKGLITQLVPMNRVAWHAGQSKWDGRALCNGFTVGLEIDNPGRMIKVGEGIYKGIKTFDVSKKADYGPPLRVVYAETPQHGKGYWLAYSDEQIEAVVALCRAMVVAYPSVKNIITHWLISPGRKHDTNPLFPLEQVRDRVLGNKNPPKPIERNPKVDKIIADATVTVPDLNLRGMAGMGDNVIAVMPKGQRIDVQDVDGDWYRAIIASGKDVGKSGYVFAKFVKLD